jgi:NAD-dependent deacetylase
MRKQHVVVLSGAGISAESGLPTFRGIGGLWKGVPVSEIASPEAWQRDPAKVLRFYNERRKAVQKAQPNVAHTALSRLEEIFRVTIITQNVDDLHERAGSTKVMHLHGEIMKARSSGDSRLLYDLSTKDIELGDTCELGTQLRPHVVWFGEPVPLMDEAVAVMKTADILIVIGTSLEVHPAASLVDYAPEQSVKFFIDPQPSGLLEENFHVIQTTASEGVPRVASQLRAMMA